MRIPCQVSSPLTCLGTISPFISEWVLRGHKLIFNINLFLFFYNWGMPGTHVGHARQHFYYQIQGQLIIFVLKKCSYKEVEPKFVLECSVKC